jgi:hypothetical protein
MALKKSDDLSDVFRSAMDLENPDDQTDNTEDQDETVEETVEETEDTVDEQEEEVVEDTTEDTTGTDTEKSDGDKKILEDNEKADEQVDFESLLSEKSGGKFKSYADIEKALEEGPEPSYANEMVAKLDEYVKAGGQVSDFLKTQTTNFAEMSDLEAIREAEALLDGTLTRDEIEILIEEEYGFAEDATDRQKTLAKIKIKKAGEAAREKLKEYQSQWAVPQATSEEQAAAARQQAEEWKNELGEAVDKNAELAFKVGDKEFKFTPSDAAKKAVKDGYDLSKFWDRYKTKDGYDTAKFVQDMYFLNNRDDIIKSIVTFAKGTGVEDVIDDIKNPGFKGDDKKGGDTKVKDVIDQIGENIFR